MEVWYHTHKLTKLTTCIWSGCNRTDRFVYTTQNGLFKGCTVFCTFKQKHNKMKNQNDRLPSLIECIHSFLSSSLLAII